MIVDNAEKIEKVLSQMEQWSILSNIVTYIHYDKHPKNFNNLNIRAANKEKYNRKLDMESEERQMLRTRFLRHTGEIERIFRCI